MVAIIWPTDGWALHIEIFAHCFLVSYASVWIQLIIRTVSKDDYH